MPKRKNIEGKHDNQERWLLTYSDMITLLLALFILLYAMSSVDAEKFKALKDKLGEALNGTPTVSGTAIPTGAKAVSSSGQSSTAGTSSMDKTGFDEVYQHIKNDIENMGLQSKIDVERGDNYILIRFKDNVLFYGDSSKMLDQGYNILKVISHTLSTINPLIDKIRIEGHTANVGESTTNMFDWQLSSNRAIAVLTYMVQVDELPQSKMSIAGYSHYVPVASNDTEEGRSRNRRVEIRITQVQNQVSTSSATTSNTTTSVSSNSSSKTSSSVKSNSQASSKK